MEKNKKNIIIVLGIVAVIIISILIWNFLIKKDNETNIGANSNNTQLDDSLINKTFTSKDGKFTLKIVSKEDKDAYEKAKKIYFSMNDGSIYYSNDNIDYYGYFNGEITEIDVMKKIGKYYIINISAESNVLLNKETNVIEEDESRLSLGDYDRFYGDTEVNQYNVFDVGDNYFFTSHNPYVYDEPYKVYTTNWKFLGYYGNYLKTDNDGIYVYDNEKLNGLPIKYNTDGIKVESKGIIGEELLNKTFTSKDNKYTLKIVDRNNKEAINDAKKKYVIDEFNEVLYLGYLNNQIVEINHIKEDNSSYHLSLTASIEDGVSSLGIVINKNTMTIEKVD